MDCYLGDTETARQIRLPKIITEIDSKVVIKALNSKEEAPRQIINLIQDIQPLV